MLRAQSLKPSFSCCAFLVPPAWSPLGTSPRLCSVPHLCSFLLLSHNSYCRPSRMAPQSLPVAEAFGVSYPNLRPDFHVDLSKSAHPEPSTHSSLRPTLYPELPSSYRISPIFSSGTIGQKSWKHQSVPPHTGPGHEMPWCLPTVLPSHCRAPGRPFLPLAWILLELRSLSSSSRCSQVPRLPLPSSENLDGS